MCKLYFLHIINHFPQCEKLGCALLIILLYISTLAILFSIESGLFKNIENFKMEYDYADTRLDFV